MYIETAPYLKQIIMVAKSAHLTWELMTVGELFLTCYNGMHVSLLLIS